MMKSRKEISEYLYKSRKINIKNQLFKIEIDFNLIVIIIAMLILFLIIDTCLFGLWLG